LSPLPSPRELALAVAAAVLRQEANSRDLIGIFSSGADADAVAAELRHLSGEHLAELLSSRPGAPVVPMRWRLRVTSSARRTCSTSPRCPGTRRAPVSDADSFLLSPSLPSASTGVREPTRKSET
jgi:hypothetical protein